MQFCWSAECQQAFDRCKAELTSEKVLVHYDVSKPLQLACDASPYGVGAVLSHVLPDGSDRPIAFYSRTLSETEKAYDQLNKEALAIIAAVKKFHKYIYGRQFTLLTDHRPLETIFAAKKEVPTLAAARLQRWALILAAHQYEIKYRQGSKHANADALSRLPLPDVETLEQRVYRVDASEELPVCSSDIRAAARTDPVLSRVYDYVMTGWPNRCPDEQSMPYFTRRLELSAGGCILWGSRVVIPEKFQETLLNELHQEHQGVVRTKAWARSYMWWPKLDADIKTLVSSCAVCQAVQRDPAKVPLHPWAYATHPWQRLHLDFAEKMGSFYLLVVDSYSKWLEVYPLSTMTASKTVSHLRLLFAQFGLPEIVVTDNGSQFTSAEFQQFLRLNGVRHKRIAPYHAATNGQAERMVQTLKTRLTKHLLEGSQLSESHKLADFLFNYRITPSSSTGQSPAELLMNRQLRSRFSLLKPNLASDMTKYQESQCRSHDRRVQMMEFSASETVSVKNNRGGLERWMPGVVVAKKGTLLYLVRCGGHLRYVHADHLRKAVFEPQIPHVSEPGVPPFPTTDRVPEEVPQVHVPIAEGTASCSQSDGDSDVSAAGNSASSPVQADAGQRRYPQRNRKPVDRLDL